MTTTNRLFTIMQTDFRLGLPSSGKLLWEFTMDPNAQDDIVPSARGVRDYRHNRGKYRWVNRAGVNDRIGYFAAYSAVEHQDFKPDGSGHDFFVALRFSFQNYGAGRTPDDRPTTQLNDRWMIENPKEVPDAESQGLTPYPYTTEDVEYVDKRHPGAVIEMIHQRYRRHQVLARFALPKTEPKNPLTHWWAQGSGESVVATNETYVSDKNPHGAIARLIVAGYQGMPGPAEAYTYRIQGMTQGGVSTEP